MEEAFSKPVSNLSSKLNQAFKFLLEFPISGDMMFERGLNVVKVALKNYEDMKSKEIRSFPAVKMPALTTLGEILVKVESILNHLTNIEKTIEKSGSTSKFCNGWIYVREAGLTTATHVNNLLTVSFDEGMNAVKLSDKYISIIIDTSSVTVKYRSYVVKTSILSKDDIIQNAEVIKAVTSDLHNLINRINSRIEACSKKLGTTH